MSHTKGPWTVGHDIDGTNYNANNVYVGAGKDALGIASVYGIPMHCGLAEIAPRYAEFVANARLIAAAPDLLAALKALQASAYRALDLYFNWDSKFSSEIEARPAITAAMDELDGAQKAYAYIIDKAEGK